MRTFRAIKLKSCLIVADALHCQKETAKMVVEDKEDYLFSVKDNQQTLKEEIEVYMQEEPLRKKMDTHTTVEKTSGRVEQRAGYTSSDIVWLFGREGWKN